MGYTDFVTKEKTQNKTLTPGELKGREEGIKIFAFQNCSWKLSSLPEGKLPMLAFRDVPSALNSNGLLNL